MSTASTTSTTERDRYPSRTVGRPTITPRLDPVLHAPGAGPVDSVPDDAGLVDAGSVESGSVDAGSVESGPLDARQLGEYERTGVLVLPGFLAPEVTATVDEEVMERSRDLAIRSTPQAILEPESQALRSLFEVHEGSGRVATLTRSPVLGDIARQLLGSDVYIHQSRINLKPGFKGKEFYWHSDFETWHTEDGMPSMRAVSCSVLLTPNHSHNGPLLTIEGSHKWFVSCVGETPAAHHEKSLRRQEVGVPDDDSLTELTRRGTIREALGPAGTVVFFECNVMHGSNGNITPDPRRNVFVVYNSVDNTLVEPFAAPAPRPTHIASRDFTPI